MICEKCSYILTGSESYCPSCGTPCLKTDEPDKNEEASSIFKGKHAEITTGIFDDDFPPVTEKKDEKKKSKSSAAFVTVLILVVVAAAGIVVADYFNISPAISVLFEKINSQQQTTTSDTTAPSQYSSASGTVTPSITYETVIAYIYSIEGLTLRKGPEDVYAGIGTFGDGTLVHIIGAMEENDSWVYVYIPEEDAYGWLNSSFLTQSEPTEEFTETTSETTTTKSPATTTTLPSTEPTQEKTTAESTTEATTENTTQATTTKKEEPVSHNLTETDKYTAVITAEEGVYMREGPGTSYKALTVLGKGEKVTVLGTDKENSVWTYVKFGDMKGYIYGSYLEKSEE